MTLEAYYGKNRETHIGRIYQKMAQDIADKEGKSVLLVNKIGGDIDKPKGLNKRFFYAKYGA